MLARSFAAPGGSSIVSLLVSLAGCSAPGSAPESAPGTSLVSASARQVSPAPPGSFFEEIEVEGRSLRIEVSLTEIGLIARGAVAEPRELFTPSASGEVVVLPGNLVILELAQAEEREAIFELASTWIQDDPRILVRGFVVRGAGGEGPMILSERAIVDVERGVTEAEAAALLDSVGGSLVRRRIADPDQYFADGVGMDGLELARRCAVLPGVERAWPVLSWPTLPRAQDPFHAQQWHHENDGQHGGRADSDVDSERAWEIQRGTAGTVIAIVDLGFEPTHPDLRDNRWSNPDEAAGAPGVDNLSGDLHGWNFLDDKPDFSADAHGTLVTGLAAARGGNKFGGSGTCAECAAMFLQGGTSIADAEAIDYAWMNGASVINLSIGYNGTPPEVAQAIQNAVQDGRPTAGGAARGCVVVVAMTDADTDNCLVDDISSLPDVIAVSSSDHEDGRSGDGYGECMELLAPSSTSIGDVGLLSTDLTGGSGLNDAQPNSACVSAGHEVSDNDYSACFTQTSAAAPVVSGIAGLVLAAASDLTAQQVQWLLQDTADRVEPEDAGYRVGDGRSEIAHPYGVQLGTTSTHGSGRVNAFEAVRVVAPLQAGGLAGVDIFVRDNRLDWGNTEQLSSHVFGPLGGFEPHWKSVDIKVDAWPLGAALSSAAEFEVLAHETPVAQRQNLVYVRVRNRGPTSASEVVVKAHWAFAGAALPSLPADFWSAFPNDSVDTSVWHPLGVMTVDVPYSGSSVAGSAADPAAVVSFTFDAPAIDLAQPEPRHHCLFVVITDDQDPVVPPLVDPLVPDEVTPRCNNVTHRNVQLADPPSPSPEPTFYMSNPYRKPIRTRMSVRAPKGVKAVLVPDVGGEEGVLLEPGERRAIQVRLTWPDDALGAEADLVQERFEGPGVEASGDQADAAWVPIGGLTIQRPL